MIYETIETKCVICDNKLKISYDLENHSEDTIICKCGLMYKIYCDQLIPRKFDDYVFGFIQPKFKMSRMNHNQWTPSVSINSKTKKMVQKHCNQLIKYKEKIWKQQN